MALNQAQLNAISTSMQISKQLLAQIQPQLALLNVAMNAADGVLATIKQGDVDQVASLSGLTVQQLRDGVFPLTGTLLNDIAAAYSALAQLAQRA